MKQHVINSTDTLYKVVGTDKSGLNGQVSYKLEGLNKPFLRNELLLVEWINYLISQYKKWVILILIKINNNDILFLCICTLWIIVIIRWLVWMI